MQPYRLYYGRGRACVQALGTFKDNVKPGSRESGIRYGSCAMSRSTTTQVN